ncbi:MAG TPA: sulfur oxidation c-type cytochrome SoxA [Chlorobaculum parvum]|uniref:SoxAX cytochrome complex subunit A n=1 Tax=Chlorobaculum parvum TaxID=274539 RepID=A0A7C5DFG9_9CHLB|nr:sulfur oxidation c-type cytochrome SoxA [Chlorobaculum parvum]
MKGKTLRQLIPAALMVSALMASGPAQAENYQKLVDADVQEFQAYFHKEFPDVKLADFANGVYALDEDSRQQWQEMEEFPPYELDVEVGKALFTKPFANGKALASCFPDGGAVRGKYPYFDEKRGEVVTLEMAINECRVKNGEKAWPWKKGDLAKVSAYMAYISRGQKADVKVKNKAAYDAYLKGKKFFYAKRGMLNMSCSGCHMEYTGRHLRAEIVSPALGHTTHFPVFRSKWGEIGTLHRRYAGCNKNIGAKPFPAQSEEYRDLEFFQTVMSNGLEYNGPALRK